MLKTVQFRLLTAQAAEQLGRLIQVHRLMREDFDRKLPFV